MKGCPVMFGINKFISEEAVECHGRYDRIQHHAVHVHQHSCGDTVRAGGTDAYHRCAGTQCGFLLCGADCRSAVRQKV